MEHEDRRSTWIVERLRECPEGVTISTMANQLDIPIAWARVIMERLVKGKHAWRKGEDLYVPIIYSKEKKT